MQPSEVCRGFAGRVALFGRARLFLLDDQNRVTLRMSNKLLTNVPSKEFSIPRKRVMANDDRLALALVGHLEHSLRYGLLRFWSEPIEYDPLSGNPRIQQDLSQLLQGGSDFPDTLLCPLALRPISQACHLNQFARIHRPRRLHDGRRYRGEDVEQTNTKIALPQKSPYVLHG